MSVPPWPAALKVGHAHCAAARTGVTVLVPDHPVVMAVDVRGGGPGTRETDALAPDNLVERVHALVFSGGSVFGLAAADALALLLAHRGVGLPLGEGEGTIHVPIVPSAILFDLLNGGDKSFARPDGPPPPYARLAGEALAAATHPPLEGPVGAAFGARAGSRRGGIGIATARLDAGGTVAALVVVNSFGEVAEGAPPEAGDVPAPKRRPLAGLETQDRIGATTLVAVATDIPLARAAARRVAAMAHDGLARAIRPIHTPFDGDTVFAIGLHPETPATVEPWTLAELGTRAADCVTIACRRAVLRP